MATRRWIGWIGACALGCSPFAEIPEPSDRTRDIVSIDIREPDSSVEEDTQPDIVTRCGDGEIKGAELCDEGALNGTGQPGPTGNICNANCTLVLAVCGNGEVEVPHESCDDGGREPGDGCNADCQGEIGEPPTLFYPRDASALWTRRPLLRWSTVPGATRYRWEIAEQDSFTTVLQSGSTNETRAQATEALPPGTYVWRVSVLENDTATATSPIQRWTLGRWEHDYNGDGFADILAGAPAASPGDQSLMGRAYVYAGGSTLPSSPTLTLTGESAGDQLGNGLAWAGDVQGDGLSDLLIGAPNASSAAVTMGGAARLFAGSSALSEQPLALYEGTSLDANLGISLSGLGDINGDGLDDFGIGAPGTEVDGNADAGTLGLYLGGATQEAASTLAGTVANASVGTSFSHAGDLNGDGIDDFVVGLPFAGGGGVAVFFGADPIPGSPSQTLQPRGTSLAGLSVAAAGDVNADGYDDLLVGAPGTDTDGINNAGQALLYLGGETLEATPAAVLNGSVAEGFYGFGVQGLGDINGDGYSDIAISTSFEPSGSNEDVGRVEVFLGGETLSTTPVLSFTGPIANALLGQGIAGPGDLNGDGFMDFVVSVPGTTTEQLWLFLGGEQVSSTPALTLSSADPNELLGWSLE